MEYIFASDPHGTGQPWIELVKAAEKKYPQAKIIFGGDYIDRRKFSQETIKFVKNQEAQRDAVVLIGNHEALMFDFVEKCDQTWLLNQNKVTVKSLLGRHYPTEQLRKKLAANPLYRYLFQHVNRIVYATNHLIFVHAGVPLNGQAGSREYDLWAREEYWYGESHHNQLSQIFAHNQTGKTIVVGHTPTCLIRGVLDGDVPTGQPEIIGYQAGPTNDCPVVKVQYAGEPARYFTDGGCQPQVPQNNGNVCVFAEDGSLIEVFN